MPILLNDYNTIQVILSSSLNVVLWAIVSSKGNLLISAEKDAKLLYAIDYKNKQSEEDAKYQLEPDLKQ